MAHALTTESATNTTHAGIHHRPGDIRRHPTTTTAATDHDGASQRLSLEVVQQPGPRPFVGQPVAPVEQVTPAERERQQDGFMDEHEEECEDSGGREGEGEDRDPEGCRCPLGHVAQHAGAARDEQRPHEARGPCGGGHQAAPLQPLVSSATVLVHASQVRAPGPAGSEGARRLEPGLRTADVNAAVDGFELDGGPATVQRAFELPARRLGLLDGQVGDG